MELTENEDVLLINNVSVVAMLFNLSAESSRLIHLNTYNPIQTNLYKTMQYISIYSKK